MYEVGQSLRGAGTVADGRAFLRLFPNQISRSADREVAQVKLTRKARILPGSPRMLPGMQVVVQGLSFSPRSRSAKALSLSKAPVLGWIDQRRES